MLFSRLFWLGLGSFAIGTEGFMIAGLLPAIVSDLGVSISTAGQLITVFALVYAVGSPVLITLVANVDRKPLLVGSLAAFALANVFAALAQSYVHLLLARVLIAMAAGLFMPTANAVAVSMVPPEQRGRAISVVTGGVTVGVALGAPLGTWIGSWSDWRMTFALVAAASLVGTVGLMAGIPRNLPKAATTLAMRLAVARRPAILLALLAFFVGLTGIYTVHSYIAPFLTSVTGMSANGIAMSLFLFGVAAAVGNSVGGIASDRYGALPMLRACFIALAVVHAMMALAAAYLPAGPAGIVVMIGIALWALVGFASYPPHLARLVSLAPDVAPITMSLNSSALYFAIAAGAALGAVVLPVFGPAGLPATAALFLLAGLGVVGLSARESSARPVLQNPA